MIWYSIQVSLFAQAKCLCMQKKNTYTKQRRRAKQVHILPKCSQSFLTSAYKSPRNVTIEAHIPRRLSPKIDQTKSERERKKKIFLVKNEHTKNLYSISSVPTCSKIWSFSFFPKAASSKSLRFLTIFFSSLGYFSLIFIDFILFICLEKKTRKRKNHKRKWIVPFYCFCQMIRNTFVHTTYIRSPFQLLRKVGKFFLKKRRFFFWMKWSSNSNL